IANVWLPLWYCSKASLYNRFAMRHVGPPFVRLSFLPTGRHCTFVDVYCVVASEGPHHACPVLVVSVRAAGLWRRFLNMSLPISLQRKSSVPETEEKVRRLRRKNTELAVIAKRLEDRARKLQEANLKVVNTPAPVRPGAVEQYKRAFARQRARDLAQHADTLLYKDKEIAALQQECRQLETRLGTAKAYCCFDDRLHLYIMVQMGTLNSLFCLEPSVDQKGFCFYFGMGQYLFCVCPSPASHEECQYSLSLYIPIPLSQARVENEELREDLSEVTAQRDSVLEENQRLRAKLENLEQVLKHMREVAERRQQLELEHEQALAILKFKQDEIKRLQRVSSTTTLDCMQSKVRELEDKCRSQSEQFGLLSHELETFRLQAGKLDLAGSALLTNHALCHLTNGVGLAGGNHGNRYYHHVPDTCQWATVITMIIPYPLNHIILPSRHQYIPHTHSYSLYEIHSPSQ
uniref:RIMB1/RIM3A-C-like N-terminal domain-containing protein n=1 Tax=Hucho hucho TaxID=62062 RepID=A0A4W5QH11_9TELE